MVQEHMVEVPNIPEDQDAETLCRTHGEGGEEEGGREGGGVPFSGPPLVM